MGRVMGLCISSTSEIHENDDFPADIQNPATVPSLSQSYTYVIAIDVCHDTIVQSSMQITTALLTNILIKFRKILNATSL